MRWERSSPFDQLHHEGVNAFAVFESVDGRDVRVVQRGKNFGFALKPREPIGVRGERARENLDRDLTLQFRIGRSIHLAHPAFADLRGDIVNAEARPWSDGQPGVIIWARRDFGVPTAPTWHCDHWRFRAL